MEQDFYIDNRIGISNLYHAKKDFFNININGYFNIDIKHYAMEGILVTNLGYRNQCRYRMLLAFNEFDLKEIEAYEHYRTVIPNKSFLEFLKLREETSCLHNLILMSIEKIKLGLFSVFSAEIFKIFFEGDTDLINNKFGGLKYDDDDFQKYYDEKMYKVFYDLRHRDYVCFYCGHVLDEYEKNNYSEYTKIKSCPSCYSMVFVKSPEMMRYC